MPKVARPPILPVEERQQLVVSCLKLAWKEAVAQWHRDGKPGPLEEYVSTAYLGLCLAAKSFDPDRGWQFTTYATKAIRQNFVREYNLKQAQCRRDQQKTQQGSQLENTEGHSDNAWWAGAAEPEPEEWDLSWLDQLRRLKLLTARQEKVLWDYYMEEKSLEEIGRELRVSKERVRQIRVKALKGLQQYGQDFLRRELGL